MQVVIFTGDTTWKLENLINTWLNNHRDYDVVDINYAGKGYAGSEYSAMIVYR